MSIAEKLTILAENEEKVFEAGKKAEYDRFWDSYLDKGNRTNYNYAFSGDGWDEEMFKPKYPIKMVGESTGAFGYSNFTDLRKHIQDNGIVIDTSKVTICNNMLRNCPKLKYVPFFDLSNATAVMSTFYYSTNILEVGGLDCSNATDCNRIFYGCNSLKKIGLFRVSEKCTNFEYTFNTDKIEEIDMQGTISADISFNRTKVLNKKSIESIINALSSTATGKSITFSQTARNNAFTDEEWATLISTKPNWTISLA